MKYLFLDESFDGFDPIMVQKIKKIFLALKNATIIITSYRMEVVNSMCDEFYVLKDGIILDSKKNEQNEIIVRVNKEVPIGPKKN